MLELRDEFSDIAMRSLGFAYRLCAVAVLGLVLFACSPRYVGSASSLPKGELTEKNGWTHVRTQPVRQQGSLDCGRAATQTVLRFWSADAPALPDRTARWPVLDLRDALVQRGLRAFVVEADITDLEHELNSGRPVLVGLYQKYSDRELRAHYEVVVGIHPERAAIATFDPAQGFRSRSFHQFLEEWKPASNVALITLPPSASS